MALFKIPKKKMKNLLITISLSFILGMLLMLAKHIDSAPQ